MVINMVIIMVIKLKNYSEEEFKEIWKLLKENIMWKEVHYYSFADIVEEIDSGDESPKGNLKAILDNLENGFTDYIDHNKIQDQDTGQYFCQKCYNVEEDCPIEHIINHHFKKE